MLSDHFLDALLSLPKLGNSAVSPDGAWVAWTWADVGPTTDVFCTRTDGTAAPIRLTETEENTWLVSWAPDNRAIVVAQDQGGDERVQLFRVDLDRPCGLLALTEPHPPYYLRGGQLHPNGRWLVYGMNFDAASGKEIDATWVYRHDLESGERKPLARPRKPAYYAPALNDAGTHILYNRQDADPAGSQVWLTDIEGDEDREILNFGPTAKVDASWLPDSDRVLFVAEAGSYRRVGLWSCSRDDIRWLIDDPRRNVESAFVPRGSDRPCAIVLETRDARTHASLLDIETGAETHLPERTGTMIPRRPLPDGTWIGRVWSSTQPHDLVRYSPHDPHTELGASLTQIWDHTSIRPHDLIRAEDFRWRSIDGLPIQGWLYRARGEVRGTVVRVHGGPTAHSEDDLNAQIQFVVHRGFNVLDPNYRGSTGFGLEFQEAIKADGWGGREQDDIRSGIEALIASGVAMPGKVGVTGTSYGGYSSWCAITRCPPRTVAAAAPICGMTDLVVDYETTRPDLRPYSEEMLGGRPDQVPQRYIERSPIHSVDRIRGRLLIVQGLRDPNVTPDNVRAVRQALDEAGIAYEILTFEDEGHGISRPHNKRILYQRLADFFSAAFAG